MSNSVPDSLPARTHRKSRAGCKTCKSRKVKCDEQRPACAKCIKYNVRCDFLGKNASTTPTPGAAAGSDGLNLADLELLHNYITATVSTMNDSPIIRDFYKTTVVKMGLSCDYIMRAALSISSLHLAHYRPHLGEHYRSLAIAHHQAASAVALTKMAQDITPDTARDLFVFSILTIFFALGCPRKEDDFLLIGESGFPDWMFLLKGTRSFIEIGDLAHLDGPLAALIRHGAYRLRMQGYRDSNDGDEPPTPAQVSLSRLQELISQQESDENLRRIYASSINELRKSFAIIVDRSSASQDIADAFVWIYMAVDEFIPLLRQPTQPALAIFAYFCVLLKKLDAQWWLHGWADHLMRKLDRLLDEEHRLWVLWPMEEMGYVS